MNAYYFIDIVSFYKREKEKIINYSNRYGKNTLNQSWKRYHFPQATIYDDDTHNLSNDKIYIVCLRVFIEIILQTQKRYKIKRRQ